MLKRTATYHEFLDDRGHRYVVRLCEGIPAGVVTTGLGEERIEWQRTWGRYHPQCTATAERLVAEYERRRAVTLKPKHQPERHEQQLPVADRA